jgi:hypothetical protein
LKRNPKTPSSPKPRTKIVRIDLTLDDQIAVNGIMREQLLDPTRMGADRVSQKSAILHAVRAYAGEKPTA